MAKREEEMKEIRVKTTEELNEEVVDLKGELFMLRLQKSARNEFKSSEFGRMRKRVLRKTNPLYVIIIIIISLTCIIACQIRTSRFQIAMRLQREKSN